MMDTRQHNPMHPITTPAAITTPLDTPFGAPISAFGKVVANTDSFSGLTPGRSTWTAPDAVRTLAAEGAHHSSGA
jgi:hypothetical protein